jgi:hypothetical protein
VRVRVNPRDESREDPPTPVGVKVRYALAMAAFFVVAVGATIAIRNTKELQDQAASQAQLRRTEAQLERVEALQAQQLLQGCQRQNVLRRSDNNAHYGDYVVFSFVAKRFLVPTPTETPVQKRITNDFAGKLHLAVADASWTPPTDCKLAVGTQGVKYRSPSSVLFTTRLPPASALPRKDDG